MHRILFKTAASTLIVALTMVSTTSQSFAMRTTSSETAPDYRNASRHHEQAIRSLQKGEIAAALDSIEQAVALSPRDVGYRMLLAELYMKSGRFQSARTTFADVVELDPAHERGNLSLALMNIAVGRSHAAVSQLEMIADRADPSDIGLAFALAGETDRAIAILEPAARAFDATPRLRQNLALTYALAGDWRRARAVAAQDVAPEDLAGRLQQWAAFARPDSATVKVAGLLGVTPVSDDGQPVRLALAPAAAPVGYAAADAPSIDPAPQASFVSSELRETPAVAADRRTAVAQLDSDWGLPVAPSPVAPAPVTVEQPPIELAQAAPAPAVEASPSPEAASWLLPPNEEPTAGDEAEEIRVAAVETLSRPQPALVRAASVSLPAAPTFARSAPRTSDIRRGDSRFVVQLGAFSTEGNAERAWLQAEKRFGLDTHVPLTTTIRSEGRLLHRVSVAGFATRGDAVRLCGDIRREGGACFVRTNAGDASIRWAARYLKDRSRDV